MLKYKLAGLEYKYTLNIRSEMLSELIENITRFIKNYMPIHPEYLKPDLRILRSVTYSIKLSIPEAQELVKQLSTLIKARRGKIKEAKGEYEITFPDKTVMFMKLSDSTLNIHLLMSKLNLYEVPDVVNILAGISKFTRERRVVIVGNLNYIDAAGVHYFAYYQVTCIRGEGTGMALIRTEA